MIKQFALLGFAALVLGSSAVAIAQNTVDTTDPNYVEQYGNAVKNYIYPDNSQVDVGKFNANKQRLEQQKLNPGLQLKSVKLMKYSDYIEGRKKYGTDILENMMVHPNRQILLVEIDAPNGVNLPKKGNADNSMKQADSLNGNTKKDSTETQKLKKAKLFYVFDAETGEYFNADINEV